MKEGRNSAADELSRYMGAAFYRNVGVETIKNMKYSELKYWHKWHEAFEERETAILQALGKVK